MKGLIAGLILFYGAAMGLNAQSDDKYKVSVVDENNSPLPNVNVLVDESYGTTSDLQGNVFLDNETARFSYVGYKDTTITIDRNTVLQMTPKAIESETIFVEGSVQNTISVPEKKIAEPIYENANFVGGNSNTARVFGTGRGFIMTPGNFNFATADETDFHVKINGMKANLNGFLGYDAPWFGDKVVHDLYTVGMSPKNPRGQLGLLDFRTDFSQGDRLRVYTGIDVIRGQASVMFPVDNTVVSASYEHNLLSDFGIVKLIEPKKDQLLLAEQTKFESSQWTNSIFLSRSSINLQRNLNPRQDTDNYGLSSRLESVDAKVMRNISYVFSYQNEDVRYGEDGFIANKRIWNEISLQETRESSLGILTVGAEIHADYYELSFNLPGLENTSIVDLFNSDSEKNFTHELYFPTYLYWVVEKELSDDFGLEFGSTFLFDPVFIRKGVAMGPYVGVSYSGDEFTAKLVATERYSDQDFQIINDGIFPLNYKDSKFPKSDQLALTLDFGDVGMRMSYIKFRDQHNNSLSLNPGVDMLLERYDIERYQNMSQEELIQEFPQLAEDPESLVAMLSLIEKMPEGEEELNEYYKKYSHEKVFNRNRDVVSLTAWYSDNSNLLVTGTLSRSAEEGLLLAGGTPYANGIDASLKAFYNLVLYKWGSSSNFTLSSSLQMSSGTKYTRVYGDQSLVKEAGLTETELELLRENFDQDMVNFMQRERMVQGQRNAETLSPNWNFNFGLSFNTGGFSIGAFVVNPQLFFKNTFDKYDTGAYNFYRDDKVVQGFEKGPGALGGASLSYEF